MNLLRLQNDTAAAMTCRLEPWPLAITLPPAAELAFTQDLDPSIEYLELDLASNSILTLFGIDRQPGRVTLGGAELELYPPSTFRREQPPRPTPPVFPPTGQPASELLTVLVIDRRGHGLRLETNDGDQHFESGGAWVQLGTVRSGGIAILENGVSVSAPHSQFSA